MGYYLMHIFHIQKLRILKFRKKPSTVMFFFCLWFYKCNVPHKLKHDALISGFDKRYGKLRFIVKINNGYLEQQSHIIVLQIIRKFNIFPVLNTVDSFHLIITLAKCKKIYVAMVYALQC